jgi:hypothetical protein
MERYQGKLTQKIGDFRNTKETGPTAIKLLETFTPLPLLQGRALMISRGAARPLPKDTPQCPTFSS